MTIPEEDHNEIDRDIYYNKIELKILKSINKINQEIFTIQESIIDYEQFGQKQINDFKPFLRNYPFQISFDEFSPSNYWGCEGDEEFLNNPPTREKEKELNEKKWVTKIFFSHDERQNFIEHMKTYFNIFDYDKQLINSTHGKEFILNVQINKKDHISGFKEI